MNQSDMMDRRNFLKSSFLLTTAAMTTSSINASAKPAQIKQSLQEYLVKKYENLLGGALKGISDGQLKAHFALYEGYIKKINDLESRIGKFDPNDPDTVNYRGWHLEQTGMLNGAVLHELYFGNLGSAGKEPHGNLKKIIDRDFGDLQNFLGHLKAVGKIVHGWAIAALNQRTGKINIYGLERHNLNVPVMVYPILVLDVYEHAYMIDYGTDRKKYLDVFVENLSWKPVEDRLELALSIPFGEAITN